MRRATVSADIIRSTSLDAHATRLMHEHLHQFLARMEERFDNCWGRIIRGDGIECVLGDERLALRVALMLKCHIKAFNAKTDRYVYAAFGPRYFFNRFGVRIAIGFGDLRTNDKDIGIIDGAAIYNSGRLLDSMSRRMRTNIVVAGDDCPSMKIVQTIATLCDTILTHATSKQCEVLFMRMQGMSELEIAERLKITQVATNGHLRRAGWYALERAMQTFEDII